MIPQTQRAGSTRWIRITGIAFVLAGAVAMAASAASRGFDLGEDLELGRAVHDADGGPVIAWIAAAVLVVVAGVAVVSLRVAARLLSWLGIGAALATVMTVVALGLFGDDGFGFAAIPFVVAFFSTPALIISLLFRQAPDDAP